MYPADSGGFEGAVRQHASGVAGHAARGAPPSHWQRQTPARVPCLRGTRGTSNGVQPPRTMWNTCSAQVSLGPPPPPHSQLTSRALLTNGVPLVPVECPHAGRAVMVNRPAEQQAPWDQTGGAKPQPGSKPRCAQGRHSCAQGVGRHPFTLFWEAVSWPPGSCNPVREGSTPLPGRPVRGAPLLKHHLAKSR